jgi:hypothetical protein
MGGVRGDSEGGGRVVGCAVRVRVFGDEWE